MNNYNEVVSTKLFKLFKKYVGYKFLFVEPGGNCGDYLIYKGAEKLANLSGISYEKVTHENFMAGMYSNPDVIYIHGSGGFVPWWSQTPILELKKALRDHSGTIIVGPSTFALDEQFFYQNIVLPLNEKKTEEIYLFCRELTSYYFVKSYLSSSNILLEVDHDTALNITPNDFKIEKSKKRYNALFLREDKENPFNETYMKYLFLDPGNYTNDFNEWINLHSSAKMIITNRLHSSILGKILGKKVILLPNSYHKNRSVWEYSLKDKLVVWKESLGTNKYFDRFLNLSIPKKILSSYKISTFIRNTYYKIK